jgi:chromosome segregation ATPase
MSSAPISLGTEKPEGLRAILDKIAPNKLRKRMKDTIEELRTTVKRQEIEKEELKAALRGLYDVCMKVDNLETTIQYMEEEKEVMQETIDVLSEEVDDLNEIIKSLEAKQKK